MNKDFLKFQAISLDLSTAHLTINQNEIGMFDIGLHGNKDLKDNKDYGACWSTLDIEDIAKLHAYLSDRLKAYITATYNK